MPIRLSGMQSGLDTEALVSALVMGYRTKKEDYEKEFIHGSCVAAEFVHVYLLRLR